MPKLQAGRAVKLLLHKFAGRVRLAYRHFPLEGVHPHALHGALAAAQSCGARALQTVLSSAIPKMKLNA
jgi:hypothetical protein